MRFSKKSRRLGREFNMCVDWWCSHSDKSYHLRKVAVLTMVNVFRFGFGRYSTVEEVDYTAERCIKHVTRLREMSPLWEMVQVNILSITIHYHIIAQL